MKRILYLVRSIIVLAVIGVIVAFLGLPNQWLLYIEAALCLVIAVIGLRLRNRVREMYGDMLEQGSVTKEREVVGDHVSESTVHEQTQSI